LRQATEQEAALAGRQGELKAASQLRWQVSLAASKPTQSAGKPAMAGRPEGILQTNFVGKQPPARKTILF
jgi:hypothetical protein